MIDEEGKLTLMMVELSAKMQIILEKQEELGENIAKIKEAVYNPDQGLYARLRELDNRLQSIEKWKDVNTKILWVVVTTITALVAQSLWASIF
tara:strand:- start:168 stop:446 length:279 start_codon:yes stop_codon:yes gene_type:complete